MKNFNEIYMKIYKENVDSLEYLRKKTKNQLIFVSIICVLIGIILTSITKNLFFINFSVVIVFLYLGISKSKKQYNEMFKENIIKSLVKEHSNELTFEHKRGVTPTTYLQAEFERFDNYESEDLITGILEGRYHINMGEVKTQRESRDSDGNTTTYTLFHGLFANVKLDKTLNATIKIRKNDIYLFKGKQRLEMDSGEFEKVYNVYTTDKIIAMQLLTADIMQMLLDFKEKNKLTPEITIKGNNLYIRFYTGEIFEGSLMKSALDYNILDKYYRIISFTLKLIESFSKNISETEI